MSRPTKCSFKLGESPLSAFVNYTNFSSLTLLKRLISNPDWSVIPQYRYGPWINQNLGRNLEDYDRGKEGRKRLCSPFDRRRKIMTGEICRGGTTRRQDMPPGGKFATHSQRGRPAFSPTLPVSSSIHVEKSAIFVRVVVWET